MMIDKWKSGEGSGVVDGERRVYSFPAIFVVVDFIPEFAVKLIYRASDRVLLGKASTTKLGGEFEWRDSEEDEVASTGVV